MGETFSCFNGSIDKDNARCSLRLEMLQQKSTHPTCPYDSDLLTFKAD
jgi:hypothetical protein